MSQNLSKLHLLNLSAVFKKTATLLRKKGGCDRVKNREKWIQIPKKKYKRSSHFSIAFLGGKKCYFTK